MVKLMRFVACQHPTPSPLLFGSIYNLIRIVDIFLGLVMWVIVVMYTYRQRNRNDNLTIRSTPFGQGQNITYMVNSNKLNSAWVSSGLANSFICQLKIGIPMVPVTKSLIWICLHSSFSIKSSILH